jgi:alginate O-acetyltransferase complex protein AlgJ
VDPEFHMHLSRLQMRSGDGVAAEASARKAIELLPPQAALHEHLGHILVQIDRIEDARREFELAVELDPLKPTTLDSLSRVLSRLGQTSEAVRLSRRAVELAPSEARFQSQLASVLHRQEELGGADAAPESASETKAARPVSGSTSGSAGVAASNSAGQDRAPDLSERVVVGLDGWLFHTIDDVFGQVCGGSSLSERNLSRLTSLWEARQAWCEVRGIQYRTVIVPERHVLYPDKLPDDYAPHPDRPALRIIRNADRTRDTIIYPVETIRNGRKVHEVCYKTDVHWTQYGAYLAYRELMDSIPLCASRIVPEASLERREQQRVGDMTLWLNQRTREVTESFEPPAVKVTEVFTNRTFKSGQVDVYETEDTSLPTLVLFRTSNATHFLPFFFHHFSRIVAVASTAVHFDLLRSEAPDVVISEISERYLAAPMVPPRQDWIRFPHDFQIESFTDFTGVPLPLPTGRTASVRKAAAETRNGQPLAAAQPVPPETAPAPLSAGRGRSGMLVAKLHDCGPSAGS